MDPTRILQEAQRTFTNDVEIDGLETQTVVSTLNQETIAQSSSENLSKLSQVIKDQIKVGKKGWDAATLQESFTQHALKRKGTKSVLVGLLPLSFEIPEEFLIPDMDEINMVDMSITGDIADVGCTCNATS
ncbi:unnamed protein product [Dovyalis caffra]|uniref:Uncharacterized protein n=1 Tax=Dovyalis caffra TaxID=77055 RepID=A0AAV1RG50_9ROSI|nr:unnamed protein product [Dovyalis caffra]